MISPMTGVQIAGPLRLFHRTVETVQEAGVLHVVEVPLSEGTQEEHVQRIRPTEAEVLERKSLEEMLRVLEEGLARLPAGLASRLKGTPELLQQYRRWEREPLSAVSSAVRVLQARMRSLVRRQRNLGDDLEYLSGYEEVAAALAPLAERNVLSREFEFRGIIFEKTNRLVAGLLEKELQKLTAGRYSFYTSTLSKGRTTALVGFPSRMSEEVRDFIAKSGIAEMSFPRYLRGQPFEQALATLEADLEALRGKQRALAAQVERFQNENGLQILALRHVCRDRLARHEAFDKFARTEYAFIIHGWLLASELARLSERLNAQAGPAVVVRPLRARSMGTPPVLLRNPRPIRSFEPLLGLLPLPRYGSIDPTKFLATFFPPMFGLMLGDIGYGLLLAVGAAMLFLFGRRKPRLRSLAVIAAICAFFTVGFGLVFGELFGDLGHRLGLQPLWRERFSLGGHDLGEAILGYLAIAVGVGVLQIIFGLVLGMINARRAGDRNMLWGNLARIAGILVLFFFVGRLVRLLPPVFSSFGIAALVAFLAIMIWQSIRHPMHGMMLPLEVLSTIGNILSYARIMAIGVASVILALLATTLAGMMGNVVLAAIIVILVHALNLALGIIDPTIQGLRLHYVEFFSKFLLTGGKRFSPLNKLGGAIA